MPIQYELKITGRVQRVGFRYYTYSKANELGLKGWVKNTKDGGVLIVVQGKQVVINTFIDFLQIGPELSRVDKISKVKIENLSDFDNFSVKY